MHGMKIDRVYIHRLEIDYSKNWLILENNLIFIGPFLLYRV